MAKPVRTARRPDARQSASARYRQPQFPGTVRPSPESGAAPAEIDTAEQTIRYIAELTEQLSCLAGGIKENSLAYFLSMARAEAELAVLRLTSGK